MVRTFAMSAGFAIAFYKEGEDTAPFHTEYVYASQKDLWQHLEKEYTATHNGRVEIFTFNTSDIPVFFDNFTIDLKPTMIVQENHYYPYGLNINGIEKHGMPNHRFQYNGKEKQEEFGLNWNAMDKRGYDLELGRWHTIDPLADLSDLTTWSPYHYSFNNPVIFNDPRGDAPPWWLAMLISGGKSAGEELITQIAVNALSGNNTFDIDWADVGVEFGYGATFTKNPVSSISKNFARVNKALNKSKTATRAKKITKFAATEGVKASVDVKVKNGKLETSTVADDKNIGDLIVDIVAGPGGGAARKSVGESFDYFLNKNLKKQQEIINKAKNGSPKQLKEIMKKNKIIDKHNTYKPLVSFGSAGLVGAGGNKLKESFKKAQREVQVQTFNTVNKMTGGTLNILYNFFKKE